MNENTWERAGAASGFAMVLFGAAAMVFERAPVTATDFAARRLSLWTRSMLFLAGGAATLWFLGSLRTLLARAEGEPPGVERGVRWRHRLDHPERARPGVPDRGGRRPDG